MAVIVKSRDFCPGWTVRVVSKNPCNSRFLPLRGYLAAPLA
jgi:hypothetical protein